MSRSSYSGILTFLFTDIENSTPLWERHPELMQEVSTRHDELLRTAFEANNGQIVKTTGDGFHVAFESPADGISAALAGQQALEGEGWPQEVGPLKVRMGLHSGESKAREGDYYGPEINRAARVMGIGYGGQVLVSSTTVSLLRGRLPGEANFVDLGLHRLKGLADVEHIYQLTHPSLEINFPPLRSAISIRHNLPAQTTPFIGRQKELAELRILIDNPDIRLVTIVGPGGMGKTRLAIAAAELVLESQEGMTFRPSDGIFFVDLAPLSETKQIPMAIADALEIELTDAGDGPVAQLTDFLADKSLLLILDNFEDLLDGAQLVSELMTSAPDLQILVTSRQRLSLHGEQIYTIPGLDFRDSISPDDAVEYSAAQLFVNAARRMRFDFELQEADLPHLARLCRLVGGMPLALELAAGWVELLSIPKIADEIRHGIGLLETDLQDMPERQRSMRAVFESTWEKLEPEEQNLLLRLSVFRGGFTLDAAQAVLGDKQSLASTLKLLSRLNSKSLLGNDPARERYQLHELLRQYAAERLESTGELEAVRTAHADYFFDLLQRQKATIKGLNKRKQAFDIIDTEFANIQVAWKRALAKGNLEQIDNALFSLSSFAYTPRRELDVLELLIWAQNLFASGENPLANPIWRRIYVFRSGLGSFLGRRTLDAEVEILNAILVEERKDGHKPTIAHVLFQNGAIQSITGNFQVGLRLLEESLAIFRELEDTFWELSLLDVLSWMYLIRGVVEKRVEYTHQRLDLAKKIGDDLHIADATAILGFADEIAGRYAAAEGKYEQALPVYQEYGERYHYAEYLSQLAGLALLKGELDRARELIREAEEIARQLSNPIFRNVPYGTLGMLRNLEGEYDDAIRQSQKIPDAHTTQSFVFYRPKVMAYAQCGLGDFSPAKNHLLEALETAIKNKAAGWQVQCLPAAALIAAAEDELERAAELLSLAYHHPAGTTGWLEKFPLIIKLREHLEKELTKDAFETLWERGKSLDLGEIDPTSFRTEK